MNIFTLNANNQQDAETIVNTATDFFDNDNNWQAAEHGMDRYATDVHWATQNVIDYWQQVHGRNSIDGHGIAARGYVHTSIPASNNVNAYWDRTTNAMFYGDGDGFTGPVAAFDVVAHEFGHCICQHTSNLNAGSAESGALNEGFSDIWGAAIEMWAAPNKQRWLMGEDIFPQCLRNLQDPNDALASEGPHPDTYHGTFWDNGGEPHTNSTVLSHWFFLVSEGGNGTNDIGNAFNVIGIGINDAARIVYLMEQLLNSNADYNMARTMSIQAAVQLFGSNSCQEIAVINAWFAVGVGNAFPGITGVSISGPDLLCNTETYSIPNLPTGTNVTWNGGSWVTITPQNPNGSIVSVTNNGNSGAVYLTATITSTCGAMGSINKWIKIGAPTWYTLTQYYSTTGWSGYLSDINCLKTYTFPGMYSGDISLSDQVATSYAWTFVSKYPGTATVGIGPDPQNATVTVKPQGARVVYRLTTSNVCGSYSHDYRFDADGNFCGINPETVIRDLPAGLTVETTELSIKPNPANSFFTIELPNKYLGGAIKIMTMQGQVIKKEALTNNVMNVDVQSLTAGVYLAEITTKSGETEKRKIVVGH